MGLTDLTVRLLVSFLTLVVLARLMGRKEISQLTLFNFISAMTLGTLGGALIIDPDITIEIGLLSLSGWAALTVGMAYFDVKSLSIRRIVEGEPVIVIKDGKIMEKALKQVQLDIGALNTMLREKGLFSMIEVKYAIFETNGELSVLKVEQEHLNKTQSLATELISDGSVNQRNLEKVGLSEKWLKRSLSRQGIDSIDEVFYAELMQDGTLYIDRFDDRQEDGLKGIEKDSHK